MPVQDHLPPSHSNQYSADSACGHCDGVIRHELWLFHHPETFTEEEP
jgi:hypothetical protein